MASQAGPSPGLGESGHIHERIFDAIADQRLPAGTKPGADKLSQIFSVNRMHLDHLQRRFDVLQVAREAVDLEKILAQ